MNSPLIFDRNRLRLHRDRAAKNISNHNFLIELSSDDILERLVSMDISISSILEIGAGTGLLTQKLMTHYPHSYILATDISETMLSFNPAPNKIIMDEEDIESLPQSFDTIVSTLCLHQINDIKKFLSCAAKLLKPQGVFIASLFGGSSLTNLRSFLLQSEIKSGKGHSPHISPFATANDMYRLLQLAGFEFIITDSQKIEADYESALACMYDLRNMGESGNLMCNTRPLSKAILQEAKVLGEFSDYAEIITLTAKKPA